ncbi:MAG: hypothetical protein R3B93_08960 [Bacteroidia bacterium]
MKDQDHQYISQYLAGALSASDKKAFEQRISNDPELANMVELYKGTDLLLKEAYLHQEIGGILEGLEPPEEEEEIESESVGNLKQGRFSSWYWGIAASLVLLVGVGIWYMLRPPLNERVFEEYFEVYLVGGPTRKDNDKQDYSFFVAGWQYYETKRYEVAVEEFEKVSAESILFGRAEFFRGVSLLGLKRYKEAEEILTKIVDDESSALNIQAKWYLGLAYLGSGDVERARQLFEELGRIGGEVWGSGLRE